jgi:hypothetical protein
VAMYPRTLYSTPFSESYNAEDGLRCEAVWGYERAGASGAVFRMAADHFIWKGKGIG